MKPIRSKRLIISLVVALGLLSGGVWGQGKAVLKKVAANRDCGVNCLVVACKLLGKTTTKQEMSTLAKLGVQGTNFHDMANAARQKGLFCKGVRWNLGQLRSWDKLAIAHWENHFVLVHGFESHQRVRVIDPPRMPFTMPADEFDRTWNGKLLLVSDEPIRFFVGSGRRFVYSATVLCCLILALLFVSTYLFLNRRLRSSNKPGVGSPWGHRVSILILACIMVFSASGCRKKNHGRLEKSTPDLSFLKIGEEIPTDFQIDFGRARQNTKLNRGLVLENATNQVINIKGISTSCACAAAMLFFNDTATTESVRVNLRVDTTGMFGAFRKPCLISFENPERKPLRVDLVGFVFAAEVVFHPPQIDFGDVPVGTCASRVIKILNKDDKLAQWRITDLGTSSRLVKAEYRQNDGVIVCQVSESGTIAPFEEKIIVEITTPNSVSTTEIAVTGNIVGPLKVEPKRLFVGNVKKRALVRVLFSISSLKNGTPFTVSPVGNTEIVKLLGEKKDLYEYCVQIKVPDTLGFFEDEVVLKTDLKKQGFLHIPYAGFVRE
jgi:hypothetical protein